MMEMITAIALWCGPPVYSGIYGLADRSKKDVQECRERLLKCLTEDPKVDHKKCFAQEKLK